MERIVAERGSLHDPYSMLLHSPPVAAGWLGYLSAIRLDNGLPGDVRELVIMYVALLNRAPFEAAHHAPIAIDEGITAEQLEALGGWRESHLFTGRHRAALAFTEASTRDVQVPDDVFAAVRTEFDDRGIVELTATVAAYNMVSRFLEALQIRPL